MWTLRSSGRDHGAHLGRQIADRRTMVEPESDIGQLERFEVPARRTHSRVRANCCRRTQRHLDRRRSRCRYTGAHSSPLRGNPVLRSHGHRTRPWEREISTTNPLDRRRTAFRRQQSWCMPLLPTGLHVDRIG